jgi:FkbM family methyltransferase
MRGAVRRIRVRALEIPVAVRLDTTDLSVLHELFLHDGYTDVVDGVEGPIRTVVDLGSNIGLTLRYWREKWPAALLVGVEADPSNFAMCRRNIDLAKMQATLINAFAAASPGEVHLDASAGEWAVRKAADGSGPRIRAITVPEVLNEAGVDGAIDLLKCDIEGAEREVFADCADWIGRVRNLVIETHQPYTTDELVETLRRNGYRGEPRTIKNTADCGVVFFSAPRGERD